MKRKVFFNPVNKFIVPSLIKIGKRLAGPDVFFYCGLYMMILLFIGTISQKYIGLYQSQVKYFSSFFFFVYGLPLPAGRTVMGIILISLLLKVLLFKKPNKKNIGTNVVHIGAILLLTGGFITGLFSKEAYLSLLEGEKSNIISDYHKVELAIISKDSGKTLSVFPEKLLISNTVISDNIPFPLKIKQFMKNSEPIKRDTPAEDSFKGFAKIFQLKNKKREKVNEENLSGLSFQILKAGQTENYAVLEQAPIDQTVLWEKKIYIVQLRPVKTYLPFSIELIDFEKTNYPGTNKAKSFKSIVNIMEAHTKQRRVIRMNQPLRHKGYTFYQSSFIEQKGQEMSVLAVVQNRGRAFPYIASLIMCFGLLLHITLKQT